LLLVAALFDRLREIKGPGGFGIGLSSEEREKIVELVPQALQEKTGTVPSPEETAHATANAIAAAEIRRNYSFSLLAPQTEKPDIAPWRGAWIETTSRLLSDADLKQVVEQTVRTPATDEPPTE